MRALKDKLKELKLQATGIWPELNNKRQFNKAKIVLVNNIDCWGMFWVGLSTIEISDERFKDNYFRTVNEVVGHELCHLIVPLLYPGIGYTEEDAHGKEWQEVMNKMRITIDPIDLL